MSKNPHKYCANVKCKNNSVPDSGKTRIDYEASFFDYVGWFCNRCLDTIFNPEGFEVKKDE